MVAPVIAAAGIGAVGSLLGGIFGGGGSKKAAQIAQQTAREQIAANQANLSHITGLSQPAISRGNAAADIYSGLLGAGGDAAASSAALGAWRGSTGYQDLLNTGLGAVNANAYARGTGDSGATLRALQRTGMGIANQNQQQYLGNLSTLIQTGNSAIGNVAGVSTRTTAMNNQALQSGADAAGNAALVSGAGWQQALKNLTNIGMNFASSYGGGSNPAAGSGSTVYGRYDTPPIFGGIY